MRGSGEAELARDGVDHALADGRIALTTIHVLATHLRADNADELIAAASGRTKAQLKDWLAGRFPRPALPRWIQPVGAAWAPSATERSPSQSAQSGVPPTDGLFPSTPLPETTHSHALARVPVPSSAAIPPNPQVPVRAHVEPLNAEQVAVRFTMDRRVLEKMERALELLGHRVAPNDIASVFERALDALLPALERQKFAATDRPQAPRNEPPANARTLSAHVKRSVWARDGGRCTFANASGKRCECRRALQYDHVRPIALGGESTLENLRLLCPAHNQLEAERRLGREFMQAKRRVAAPTPVRSQRTTRHDSGVHSQRAVPFASLRASELS